jgi:hypothetical protein
MLYRSALAQMTEFIVLHTRILKLPGNKHVVFSDARNLGSRE